MNTKQKVNRPLTADESVFVEKLIEDNKKAIKNIIYNVLGEDYKYLAEDTIYDVYLLICQKIDVLKNHSNPKAWIFVAARYVARGAVKKSKRHKTVPIEMIDRLPSGIDIEEEAIYNMWLCNNVPEKLLGSFTKRELQIYHMIYVEGKTPKETADILGLTQHAVLNFKSNIKKKIKDLIKNKKF